jgi:thioredoxin reductase (NADPH)
MASVVYDIIIVGAGPAGLTAAIYAARRKARVVVFEAETVGGQITKTPLIENYPGVLNISGSELAKKMQEQVRALGVEIKIERAVDIWKEGEGFVVKTERASYHSKAVILATGVQSKRLDVQGEEKFIGRGVSYCAICDAPLFANKAVVVVGGGDSAAKTALLVADYANKVILIHRRDALRAEPLLQDRLFANKKVQVIWNKVVEAIKGENLVEGVTLRDTKTNEKIDLPVGGIFVEVGGIPAAVLARKLGIETSEKGYVKVDKHQRTNVNGFFAAGDVTDFPLRQVSTAVGEGATAAISACEYIGK